MLQWFFHAFTPEFCVQCKGEGEVFCRVCRDEWWSSPELSYPQTLIQQHFSVGHYHEAVLQTLLQLWKYHGVTSARDALFSIVCDTIRDYGPALVPVEGVVFLVPLHWRKKNERGFDQAEELGKVVANMLGVPLLPLVERRRYTEQQARVRRDQRSARQFAGSLFRRCVVTCLVPKRLLLVDDVWTTGTTISAAADVLRALGVKEISAFTIAKG